MPRTARASPPRLAELVRERGYRIATGFVGTPLVTDALTEAGHLARRRAPAAADRVPVVALPRDDGRDHRVGALGQPAARRHGEPRRDDLVQPLRARRGRRLAAPHGRRASHRMPPAIAASGSRRGRSAALEHARASHRTPYGPASVAWQRDGDQVVVTAEVPPNTEAVVDLPGLTPFVVGSGRHEWHFAALSGCREPPPVRPRLAERRHHRRPRGVPGAARHARRP